MEKIKVKIREGTFSDIEYLAPLVKRFWEEHNELLGEKREYPLNKAIEEVKRNMSRKDSGYFLAVYSEKIIGFRRWELHEGFYFTRELYVLPEFRRKGVARALIRHFERWVLQKGQDIACISCIPHNIAMIQLARSEGYDILNMIEMRKNLMDKGSKPRGEEEALGFKWRIL
jgi:GNAT superfamily N-acetyltransferase